MEPIPPGSRPVTIPPPRHRFPTLAMFRDIRGEVHQSRRHCRRRRRRFPIHIDILLGWCTSRRILFERKGTGALREIEGRETVIPRQRICARARVSRGRKFGSSFARVNAVSRLRSPRYLRSARYAARFPREKPGNPAGRQIRAGSREISLDRRKCISHFQDSARHGAPLAAGIFRRPEFAEE